MRSRLELVDGRSARAEAIWRGLERTCRPSYFLTWRWIENWLALLPDNLQPALAVIHDSCDVACAFFVHHQHARRHGVVASRGLFVHATGVARYDELCLEHNRLLGRRVDLAELVELLPRDWDELHLAAMDRDRLGDLAVPAGYRVRLDAEVPSPYVDLARVRASGDYLRLLSANTRSQIRRAQRRVGPCVLEVAQTGSQALAIYEELVALHGDSWRARGEPGAFADPWFERFHRRLIGRRFAAGEILLMRLRAGGATLGCLYNLVAGAEVLFYQSGLSRSADPAHKPGLLCHAAAIAHCAAAGHAVYDLLAGHARYKMSLATDARPLVWLRVQRTRLRFAVEDQVRQWKHAVTGG